MRGSRARKDGACFAPSAAAIERIGRKLLDELPAPFRDHLRGVVIRVQDFPDEDTLRELEIEDPFDLLGLYRGVPLGRGAELGPPRAEVDMIFLYRRPILDHWCHSGEALEEIVRDTLLHEIGHHFGFSEDDLDELGIG